MSCGQTPLGLPVELDPVWRAERCDNSVLLLGTAEVTRCAAGGGGWQMVRGGGDGFSHGRQGVEETVQVNRQSRCGFE
jgi:hypothetical protein